MIQPVSVLPEDGRTQPLGGFGAVVPVAGSSSRMGAFKPLLPFSDSTVIETSVLRVLKFADTVVVLGNRAEELRDLLSKRFGGRLRFAYNPDYESTDMLTSVKIGLGMLPESRAFFLLPGDMPAIEPDVFAALINAIHNDDEILIPVISGRRGHPPLISSSLIPEILAYEGAGGLKAIFQNHSVKEISVKDRGILTDLDTPEDYQKAINQTNL